MAIPEEKSQGIDDFLKNTLGGKDRKTAIKADQCVACDDPDMNFREEIDRREYAISGMCQKCQDEAFGDGSDDDEEEEF